MLLLMVLGAGPLAAQQERWQQLSEQVEQLYAQGRYAEAVPLAQEALRMAEATFGSNDPNVALSLLSLGTLYKQEANYAQAESLDRRALSIYENALGPEHPGVAVALNNLGALYWQQGRYAEAELSMKRAAGILEKALGPEHPAVAALLNNLGVLYYQEGKYAEAESLYRRALDIREKALGPEHPDVANSLNAMAELFRVEGKYAEAEPLFRRALDIREKALGPEHADVANSLNNLATLYGYMGKYAEAEALNQRALHIMEKVLGPDHPDLAGVLNNLAELCRAQGKYAEAEPLMQRALHLVEAALGAEHTYVARALINLAGLYHEEGKLAEAEPLYQRAVRIQEKALGPDHPEFGLSLETFADLRFAQGLPQQAQPLYARAFDILFRNFQYHFTYMSERERLGFLQTVEFRFPIYFSFVYQFREKQPDLAGRMYDLLLWQKGFIVGSVSSMRRQVEASGDPEALKLLDQLAAKRTQIAGLLNAQPEDRQAWRKQIEQLETEVNDLERALVARSAAFAQQKKLERATWQQVRDSLQPGEAAIEFARFRFYDGKLWTDKSYYVALVVTPQTKDQPTYIVLGEGKELEGAPLIQFQQGVRARGSEAAAETVIAPSAQAYDLFWKPLEPLLAGKTRVYLAPDGVLNQMPLGLIPAPDGKLLMEEYDLRLVSSTKDLLRPAAAPAANTAVLVGDPTFDLGEAQQRAALQKLAAPTQPEPVRMGALAPGDRSRDQGSGATLPPLPGTGAEIQSLGALLQQRRWQATTYTADRALEEAVKRVRSPRVLHLATHGFFLPDQQIQTGGMGVGSDRPSGLEDPMLRSGLFFAGADRALAGQPTPEDLDDGVLTAYEATSLNLQGTELVVLSACNTGQGDVKNGEGVFGLRRALEEAGAQAVMMSLWSVPDKETQELMTLFYGKWLDGMEKHEALRQAQLAEREVVRKRYARDLPYYWGAFVLVGR
jgi:CHAT domain-containing protein/Tfp pilus assembly protein PilF